MLHEIDEYIYRDELPLTDWEKLLLDGWDRVGDNFFRRRFDLFTVYTGEGYATVAMQLMPLRYKLHTGFTFSKSQRSILRRNADLVRVYRPAIITDEKLQLFDEWYAHRFHRLATLSTWVSDKAKPFPMYEISLYRYDRLIACSFFDVTPNLQYSTTAFYDPTEMKRSLGTFTLLCEIEQGMMNQKRFHYPGHAYAQSSMYDYKKRMNNAEQFDWDKRDWLPLL